MCSPQPPCHLPGSTESVWGLRVPPLPLASSKPCVLHGVRPSALHKKATLWLSREFSCLVRAGYSLPSCSRLHLSLLPAHSLVFLFSTDQLVFCTRPRAPWRQGLICNVSVDSPVVGSPFHFCYWSMCVICALTFCWSILLSLSMNQLLAVLISSLVCFYFTDFCFFIISFLLFILG